MGIKITSIGHLTKYTKTNNSNKKKKNKKDSNNQFEKKLEKCRKKNEKI